MIETIVLDLGGVLMQHNMPGCIAKFKAILGDNYYVLGMADNGEAVPQIVPGRNIMHDYEVGHATTAEFVQAILPYCKQGTTEAEVIDAWVTMHAGVPAERIEQVQQLAKRFPIYCLSNNNEAHWLDVEENYPSLVACFRQFFLSHQLHYRKPDPRIFAEADKRIAEDVKSSNLASVATAYNPTRVATAYNPAHTIFVDDLEANCEVARRHGWQACLSLSDLQTILAYN